jgi:exonuclease SbcC
MLEVIYHISDIHIIQRNFLNIRNSFSVLVETIRNDPRKSILVIAGDIFEHKNTLYTEEIQLFLEMIQMLDESQITTIVIPGNHDCNVNLNNTVDSVSLLNFNRSKFVRVYSVTSRIDGLIEFGFNNVDFYIYSLIDKKSPQIVDNGRLRVAICHEQVQSAKYYNKMEVVNAKLSIEDFKDYHITLLGDIHNCQFLKPNIAYCGSFVQKNKGEDLNHGYILWDLTDCAGQFVNIPLKEIYLNVYAKNDNLYIPEYNANTQTVTYFCFKYSQCSKTFLDTTIEQLKKIASLDKIICLDDIISMESIQSTNEPAETQFKFSHDSIIKDTLQKMNKEHLTDRILDYHHSKMSNVGESFLKNFVIQRLEWSNLYCYGEDNTVDFKNFLHDLVVINGKNKTGKSSFIDILVFILFNKNIRGRRNDIVNKNTKSGYAAVTLKQGDNEYVLYRKKFRNSATDEFTVKKNGQPITKATIDETYQFISKEIGIGSFENFISFTTALQNRQFLLDSHKTGLVQLINSLVNIDFFDTIENDVKIEKSVLKKLGKEYTSKLEYYKDIGSDVLQLELKKQQEGACKMEELKKERDNLLKQLKDLYKDYDKNVGIFESSVTCISLGVCNIDSLKKEKIQLTYKLEHLKANGQVETTETLPFLEEQLKKSSYKDITGFSEEDKDKLSEYKFYLLSHKEDAVVYLEQLEKCNGDYCEVVESEIDIEAAITGVKDLMMVSKEKVQKFLTFGTCKDCLKNSKFLSGLDNPTLERRLKELYQKRDTVFNNKKCISNEVIKVRNAEKLKRKEKYLAIEKKVTAVTNYYFNKDLEELEKKLRYLYTNRLQEVNTKINLYELQRKIDNTIVWKSIKLLEEKLQEADKVLDSTKQETTSDYQQVSCKYQEKLKLLEAVEENNDFYEFFDTYSQLIDKKTGIKSTILKSVCASLEKYVNHYLNIITDFQILIEWDKDIQIYTTDNSGSSIPVDLASGFQKFVLDIILRISLSKMFLNNNFLNLIIDEGFGNLDTENLTEFCKVLSKLRYQFRNIFIITHNEEVKSYGTKFLNVKVLKSGKSLLSNVSTSVKRDTDEPVDKYLEKRDNKWYCKKCKSSFLDSKSKLENHIKGKKHSQ